MQVAIHQNRLAALQVIVFRLYIKADKAGMFKVLFACYFGFDVIRLAQLFYNSWRVSMVNQRVQARKTFG